MPESEKPIKTQESKWITIGGKHVEVKPGEEVDELTREKLPSFRGEKEKNTKEALSKEYVARYDYIKSIFQPRDEVVFNKYVDEGIVSGSDGDYINILSKGMIRSVHKNHVFKKTELIGGIHWDSMNRTDRIHCLNKAGLGSAYVDRNWMALQPNIRIAVRKANTPAGYESTTSGVGNPIFNPINENKTVSQRIKEEEEKQHEKDGDSEKIRNYS